MNQVCKPCTNVVVPIKKSPTENINLSVGLNKWSKGLTLTGAIIGFI